MQKNTYPEPKLVAQCKELARPGYSSFSADEYQDSPDVLRLKVKDLAALIRASSHFVVYTGAGISISAGIKDYASKAKDSLSHKPRVQIVNRLQAAPTRGHFIFSAMERKGYLKHWLQQNHDGLAQKAGFPSAKLNEIHGSWFDKKNGVVLMDDKLNPKNYEQLLAEAQRVDLCLAVGTSLSGMTSDLLAERAAERGGLVVINLQRTRLDERCALRIFGELQQVLELLGKELGLKVREEALMQPSEWR